MLAEAIRGLAFSAYACWTIRAQGSFWQARGLSSGMIHCVSGGLLALS
jgi:hypothetical protein